MLRPNIFARAYKFLSVASEILFVYLLLIVGLFALGLTQQVIDGIGIPVSAALILAIVILVFSIDYGKPEAKEPEKRPPQESKKPSPHEWIG